MKTAKHGSELLRNRDEATHCFYCDTLFTQINPGNQPLKTIDHFIPLAKGGTNSAFNKVVCCHTCNSIKAQYTPQELLVILEKYQEWGFVRQKYMLYYSPEKLEHFIQQVKQLIYNSHAGKVKADGYFKIVKNTDNEDVIEQVETQKQAHPEGFAAISRARKPLTACAPCIFQINAGR